MIFPNLELEKKVQVGDKTRLNAEKSFVSPDEAAISKIEIDPTGDGDFFDVTTAKYLDWEYIDAGDITPVVQVTTDGDPIQKEYSLTIVSEDVDKLFSSDADLTSHEPDIMKWVPAGRNSFKNIHRRAQELIIAWLDKQGYVDIYDVKFTLDAFVDLSEVSEWSKFMTLRLIFEGLSNAVDDVFDKKAKTYKGAEKDARDRAVLRIDVDGDKKVDIFEKLSFSGGGLARR